MLYRLAETQLEGKWTSEQGSPWSAAVAWGGLMSVAYPIRFGAVEALESQS